MVAQISNFFQALFPPAVKDDFSIDYSILTNRVGAVAVLGIAVLTATTEMTAYSRLSASWVWNPAFAIGAGVLSVIAIALVFFERARANRALENKLCEQLQVILPNYTLRWKDYYAIEKLKNDPDLTKKLFEKTTPSSVAKAILLVKGNEQVRSFVATSVSDEEFSSVIDPICENRVTPAETFVKLAQTHKSALAKLTPNQRAHVLEVVSRHSLDQLPSLVKAGFDPNSTDQSGFSLLMLCAAFTENESTAASNTLKIMNELVELGADPTCVTPNDDTIVSLCQNHTLKIAVEELLLDTLAKRLAKQLGKPIEEVKALLQEEKLGALSEEQHTAILTALELWPHHVCHMIAAGLPPTTMTEGCGSPLSQIALFTKTKLYNSQTLVSYIHRLVALDVPVLLKNSNGDTELLSKKCDPTAIDVIKVLEQYEDIALALQGAH